MSILVVALAVCDAKLDVEVTGMYCKLSDGSASVGDLSSHHHHWNTLYYTSIIILKVGLYYPLLTDKFFLTTLKYFSINLGEQRVFFNLNLINALIISFFLHSTIYVIGLRPFTNFTNIKYEISYRGHNCSSFCSLSRKL